MYKHKDTLKTLLQRNITAARLNPGLAARHQLGSGLRFSIMAVSENGKERIKLQLSREGHTPPSLVEWKTVLKNWPLTLDMPDAVMPARCFLVGSVPVAEVKT